MRKWLKLKPRAKFVDLPRDSLAEILSFLDSPKDWMNISKTCKQMYEDMHHKETVWGMCNMDFFFQPRILLQRNALIPFERIYKLHISEDDEKIAGGDLFVVIQDELANLKTLVLDNAFVGDGLVGEFKTKKSVTELHVGSKSAHFDLTCVFPEVQTLKITHRRYSERDWGIEEILPDLKCLKCIDVSYMDSDATTTHKENIITMLRKYEDLALKLGKVPEESVSNVFSCLLGGRSVSVSDIDVAMLDVVIPAKSSVMNAIKYVTDVALPVLSEEFDIEPGDPSKVSFAMRTSGTLEHVSCSCSSFAAGDDDHDDQPIVRVFDFHYNTAGQLTLAKHQFERLDGEGEEYITEARIHYNGKTGKATFIGEYDTENRPRGYCRHFHLDGTLECGGYYVDGQKIGRWLYYSPGSKIAKVRYLPDVVQSDAYELTTAYPDTSAASVLDKEDEQKDDY